MHYKVIIFDFFGVISSGIAPVWFGKHFSGEKALELKEKYAKPVDLGEISESDFFGQLAELVSDTPENIRNEWLKLSVINLELVEFIRNLKNKYKIALCSNAPAPFLREIIRKNNLTVLFDTIVISSEVKLIKPETAIFDVVLSNLKINREEAVFVDDDSGNVLNAEEGGIKSFIFSNSKKLESDFKLYNLI